MPRVEPDRCIICTSQTGYVNIKVYSESTHSIDPAKATVEGNFPGVGESTVYFLLCASIPVLQYQQAYRPE
jgi:hypothetical protein